MTFWRSYRTQLQLLLLTLGLAAVALTAWEAWRLSTEALEAATRDRLAGIRQARARQLERYFQDLGAHVLALSNDESVLEALEEFSRAFPAIAAQPADPSGLRSYYQQFGPPAAQWFPQDAPTLALQTQFLLRNPHPLGAKDRLLEAPGAYGRAHSRFHPTLHRYQTAFGMYDIFLIDADTGRVLYTVFKEIDLGANLNASPARDSALGKAYREALALPEPEQFVLRDYEAYIPSHGQPAAFAAAPIWRAGEKRGVLAMQVSLREVNRVMTADGNWEAEGLGRTGHTYVLGPDGLLRSDLRRSMESAVLSTGILREKPSSASDVLRSEGKLNVPGLAWTVRAEIERQEAFAPVERLRARLLNWGLVLGLLFLATGALLGRRITRPLKALADGARRLGRRDFSFRFPATRHDELGELESAFNEMVVELERTTASKADLERLAGRLITSQEDERKRVARELHDDLSQRLAALAIEAGRLEHLAQDHAELRAGFARLKQQVAALSKDVHGISRGLHPALLEDLGLETAISVEARSFFERGGPPVEVEAGSLPPTLSADARLALYRIVQESLRNIQKYADAESVHILLFQDADHIVLRIRDDGRGFARHAPGFRPGLGLASMEERARLLGGELRIDSQPGHGTLLEARLPANC